jgi:hypothetical protein
MSACPVPSRACARGPEDGVGSCDTPGTDAKHMYARFTDRLGPWVGEVGSSHPRRIGEPGGERP